MENSALEAPAHRLLVVRHEHQLHPSGRWRGPGLQGHAPVGIDVPDREDRLHLLRLHPPDEAPLLGRRVGVAREERDRAGRGEVELEVEDAGVGASAVLSMTTRSSRRTTTESVWSSSNLWATEVGEPLSLLCAVAMSLLASVTA